MKVKTDELIKIIEDANTMINLEDLTPDANLRDIGADSLDMMNILLAIQEKYGVEVPDEDVEKLSSINSIYEYLNKSL